MKEREEDYSSDVEIEIVKGIDIINKVKSEPKPELIWDNIPEKSIGLITGVGKTGKTTFAENLAMSLSIGRKEFFGKKTIGRPMKTLFINFEESYKIRGWRNEAQISIFSEEQLKLFSENYISTPIDFPEFLITDDDWGLLRNYILFSEAEVVFIDSLTHMFTDGDIEKSTPANKFVQRVNHYLGTLDKTIIVVHHNIKGNKEPVEQHHIAGSRVIIQKFQYAYGFANLPTGGSYCCMLNNKYVPCDSSTATIYEIDKYNWFHNVSTANKYSLYKDYSKIDGREDPTNPNTIYDYFESMISTGSTDITSEELHVNFVESKTMAKDTLYRSINKLMTDGKIAKVKKGVYTLVNNNPGKEIQNEGA